MLGLIKKDLLLLKTNTKIFIGIIIFYIIFGVASDFGPAVIISMIALIFGMQVLTTMQLDEQYKWNPYALTMPVSRSMLVFSKYTLSVITLAMGTAIGLFCTIIVSLIKRLTTISQENIFTTETLIITFVVFGVMLFINALLLPAVYKYGVEKARIILIILVAIPAFIITGLVTYITNPNATKPAFIDTAITWCFEHLLGILPFIAAVFLIATVAISYLLSVKILEKKEF